MDYMNIKVGSKVRALRELKNGGSIVPKGAIGVVQKKYAGVEVLFESKCEHCHYGDRVEITRIPPTDVEIIVEQSN